MAMQAGSNLPLNLRNEVEGEKGVNDQLCPVERERVERPRRCVHALD